MKVEEPFADLFKSFSVAGTVVMPASLSFLRLEPLENLSRILPVFIQLLVLDGELDEAFEFSNSRWVAHFSEGFGFDLTNSLTSDLELATDFFESSGIAVLEAEALFENLAFTFGESIENFDDLVFQHSEASFLHGVFCGLVLDEVTEGGVIGVAHGSLEGDGLLGHFEDGTNALDGKVNFLGDFVGGWVPVRIPARAAFGRA